MHTDADIISEFKISGDRVLIGKLYKKYQRDVFGMAYYYLKDYDKALDVVTEVFIVIQKSLASKEIQNFKPWALSIARNLSLKMLRDDKKYLEFTESMSDFMESDSTKVYSDELLEKLIDLLNSLKDQQKTCIENFYLKGLSYADIAEKYDLSIKQVKSHIQNGKRNLKILINNSTLNLDEEFGGKE